jgi:methylase of polypeptide subunit release factors
MLGLFLLSERVCVNALPKPVRSGVQILIDVGLCSAVDDHVSMKGFGLFNVRGVWLFAHSPSIAPTLYYGNDSIALMNHVAPKVGGSCLDLCCGPGAQALVCSQRSARVVASDINPIAAALAAVNAAFNGKHQQISVRCGDLYETVAGQMFDTIIVNPPLLPIPRELPYPFVGDGGLDGLDLMRRILEGAPDHLTADGTLHSLGVTLSNGFVPTSYEELERLASHFGLDVTLTITAHVDAGAESQWSNCVGATIAGFAGCDIVEAVNTLVEKYRSAGGSHVCAYFLKAGVGRGKLRILDLSDETSGGFWYI